MTFIDYSLGVFVHAKRYLIYGCPPPQTTSLNRVNCVSVPPQFSIFCCPKKSRSSKWIFKNSFLIESITHLKATHFFLKRSWKIILKAIVEESADFSVSFLFRSIIARATEAINRSPEKLGKPGKNEKLGKRNRCGLESRRDIFHFLCRTRPKSIDLIRLGCVFFFCDIKSWAVKREQLGKPPRTNPNPPLGTEGFDVGSRSTKEEKENQRE